ncbi:MAG: SpoIVB peptidase [Clostridia bacterium]|nr:SpoIVB peptidase [Clostridia bacterium]
MKKLFQVFCIFLSAFALLLHYSPAMMELHRLPGAVSEHEFADNALLTYSANEGAAFVRRGGDQRLAEVSDFDVTARLFGIIPIKTVTVINEHESVNLGGQAVGVVLFTDGVQVVGLGGVGQNGSVVSPAANAGIRHGDTILKVDGTKVQSSEHFQSLMNAGRTSYTLTIYRDGEEFECNVSPVYDESSDRWVLGAWVRDSTTGVGTLSFYREDSLRFYALGHPVTDIDTGVLLQSHQGSISLANIFDVEKGQAGRAGELYGSFSNTEAASIGSIDSNTNFGIAGTLKTGHGLDGASLPLAKAAEVELGEAEIYSTVAGDKVESFSCRVIRADVQSSPQTQGVIIEITDRRLIDRTGGIVQGMSGSPVVQNGKLIGVVTHVFVNEPLRGYCLYAEWMSEMLKAA